MAALVETTTVAKDFSIQDLITDGRNPRGIPCAKFIDNLEGFLGDASVEVALGSMNELYSKYKMMEKNLDQSKSFYKSKIPEVEQTLELVELMKTKRDNDDDIYTNYSLCDTIYTRAKIDSSEGKVCLWVGANTMVEYTYEEAIDLLQSQLEQSHAKLQEIDEDLLHIRGNSITVEVNMARLFNHSVKIKKAAELAAQGK